MCCVGGQLLSVPRGVLAHPPQSLQSGSPSQSAGGSPDFSTSFRESHLTAWLHKARQEPQASRSSSALPLVEGVASVGNDGVPPSTPRLSYASSVLRRRRGELDAPPSMLSRSISTRGDSIASSSHDLLSASLGKSMSRRAVLAAADPTQPITAPLSYTQHSLWFLHKMDPDRVDYVVHFAAQLPDDGVDIDALRRAFEAIVDRHPALRTTCVAVRPTPCCCCRFRVAWH